MVTQVIEQALVMAAHVNVLFLQVLHCLYGVRWVTKWPTFLMPCSQVARKLQHRETLCVEGYTKCTLTAAHYRAAVCTLTVSTKSLVPNLL